MPENRTNNDDQPGQRQASCAVAPRTRYSKQAAKDDTQTSIDRQADENDLVASS